MAGLNATVWSIQFTLLLRIAIMKGCLHCSRGGSHSYNCLMFVSDTFVQCDRVFVVVFSRSPGVIRFLIGVQCKFLMVVQCDLVSYSHTV